MLFTVTYRGRDGALHDEVFDAADRAGCIAECRKRGISPTKIVEGGSGKSAASPKGRVGTGDSKRTTARWVAVAVLLVAVAGGAWWWFGGRRATALPAEKPAKPKVEKPKAEKPPKAARRSVRPATPAPAATNAPEAVVGADSAKPTKDEVVWRQVTTNSNGVVTEKYRTADGKSHRVIRHPKRVFDNASDQLIAMAISASKNGGSMPPLPLTDATEKDFLDSLMHPIEIADDDPPDVKELKRDVAAVREQLIDMVKGGMTVRQALIEHQKAVNDNAEFRGEALKALSDFRKEGDKESAEEFRKRVNEEFEKRGMAPVETRRKKQ